MDNELVELVMDDTRDRMAKAIEHVKVEFANVRTGRASSSLVENILVDYYGAETPLKQLANFSVPEPRLLVVSPFDKGAMKNIEAALRAGEMGFNPSNDGNVLRINMPQLTEERRREYVKVARHKAEEARVTIRNLRRKAKDEIDALVKDGAIGEDEGVRAEKELDSLTKKHVDAIDAVLAHKEDELLEV